MRFRLAIFLTASLLLVAGCATTPPPLRESPEASVVGAYVDLKMLLGHRHAEFAYFARLDSDESSFRGEPMRSNFERNGYVYLFNAPAGRYALVSAGYYVETEVDATTDFGRGGTLEIGLIHTGTVNVYLPNSAIEQTVASVAGGESAFLGAVDLANASGFVGRSNWEIADDLQKYYYGVIAPGHRESDLLEQAYVGRHDPGELETLDQTEASLARFLATSRKIAGDDWASALDGD